MMMARSENTMRAVYPGISDIPLTISAERNLLDRFIPFEQQLSGGRCRPTYIGDGSLGGKGSGLAFMHDVLADRFDDGKFRDIEVLIPAFTVLRTDVFDAFLGRNYLADIALSDKPDIEIAQAFQKANLPTEILGDLRALMEQARTPLAIRSSSLLEDSLHEPFAGIYTTKMIPNNQHSPDERFRKLLEAIKLVYASMFFQGTKEYMRATHRDPKDEKMAIVIQEVMGQRFGDRFYPALSGVARSYNFYSMGRARPDDGVVSLALGLGKTIVDGGRCWTYSPAHPMISPPYSSPKDILNQSQTTFWAVNMGKPPAFDPIRETEYLATYSLVEGEKDGSLRYLASTFDLHSGKITPGIGKEGPRVIDFGMLLKHKELPLNELIKSMLDSAVSATGKPVEIEFAMTFDPHRMGFLQVRPMVISSENVKILDTEMTEDHVLLASEHVLGNGAIDDIKDIIYLKPETFEARHTPRIANEIGQINRKLVEENRPYLLIGFGRWGSTDPWLGVPVQWGQIAGAKAIVEATQDSMNVEISQGSHFFHNLTSFQVKYFCVSHVSSYGIKWEWLRHQSSESETELVRHVRLSTSLRVKVDGKTGRGYVAIEVIS